jgi:hypothetical protein
MSEAVKVERYGAVAVLRVDDPSAANALWREELVWPTKYTMGIDPPNRAFLTSEP